MLMTYRSEASQLAYNVRYTIEYTSAPHPSAHTKIRSAKVLRYR
jgi:hypothetical protein